MRPLFRATHALSALCAIAHADPLIGRFVNELDRQGMRDDTLMIVTAKHGNGPIDPSRLHKIDERRLAGAIEHAAPGALGQLTTDHGALIWLRDASTTPAVTAALPCTGPIGHRFL
jgi:arylsulfatase A-like enzyme